jgi:hypothetical protein
MGTFAGRSGVPRPSRKPRYIRVETHGWSVPANAAKHRTQIARADSLRQQTGPTVQNVDLSVNYNNSTLGVDPAEQRRQDGIRQDRGIAKVAPIAPGN